MWAIGEKKNTIMWYIGPYEHDKQREDGVLPVSMYQKVPATIGRVYHRIAQWLPWLCKKKGSSHGREEWLRLRVWSMLYHGVSRSPSPE